ncbi:ccf33876-f386-4ce7-a079-3fb624725bf4 [Sclerotinia trifoliorum]|uniref:Ccf33876-f386-4ce7-a079-3fb624725bf4 n=1 Tax=Sclerotinia trifoliorum TaxID=28548 RepID=A0A8H2ZJU3_9HELO|nr:ccf33876-f386-4ce7-a079-3fb624725bf4 [Sclerotinia trifoliorum]
MISGRGRARIRAPRRAFGRAGAQNEFDIQWDILQNALQEIHEKNAGTLSFEQLYRASYKIVLKKEGDLLYDRVKVFEEQWFAGKVMPDIRKLITANLVNVATGGVSGTAANERRLTGEQFLEGLKASWTDHNVCMSMTTDVLMYMDRVYCGDNRKASIYTTAMGLFRDHILRSPLLENSSIITFDILNSVILDQIGMEREGDVINRHLIRSVIYMLEGLYETDEENESDKLYLTVFEPAFLAASRKFYQAECQTLLRDSPASTWLRQTKRRLDEESDRCDTTIASSTIKKIQKVVEQELISSHLNEFLAMEGSGLQAMIENDRFDDLTILYQLISRIDPSRDPLKVALQARVVQLGLEINKIISNGDIGGTTAEDNKAEAEEEDAEGSKKKVKPMNAAAKQTLAAIKWVDEVLRLKDKFDNMWRTCFMEDLILQTAITKSFSDFINLFDRSSEFVSLFIDDNLKRGIKGKTELEIDEVLDKATTLLRYIQDKDMFERYYKKHLAKRLLLNKSESTDVEKQMISRMKLEIGNSFTTKLEGMFKDITMSEELSSNYRNHINNLGDKDKNQIELSAIVLSTNCWPTEIIGGIPSQEEGPRQSCNWPPQLQKLQDSFKAFYLKDRNGRMLTWLGNLGNADIRCNFPAIPGETGPKGRERKYELNVNTHGMLILMLFNDFQGGQELSYEEIQQSLNITDKDLPRALMQLSGPPKSRVLLKKPGKPNELPKMGDVFTFNSSFVSKTVKIKVQPIGGQSSKVEGADERRQTEERNDEHRGSVMDTVIVRIMKARKECPHQQLVAEVISQLSQRFQPNINMMKRRIESLIEREYLERIEEANIPTYRYLA